MKRALSVFVNEINNFLYRILTATQRREEKNEELRREIREIKERVEELKEVKS